METREKNEGRLRFSLRSLLIGLTIASLMLATLTAFADAWATGALIVLLQVVPLTLLVGVVWGSRYERAFCLGAFVPAAITLLTLAPIWIASVFGPPWQKEDISDVVVGIGGLLVEYHLEHRAIAALSWLFSLLLGLVALALRRWVFRGGA